MRWLIGLAAALMFFFCGIPCAAESTSEDALYAAADALNIPDEAHEILDDAGISASEPESLLTLTPSELLRQGMRTLANEAAAPIRLCGTLLAVTILSALLGSLSDTAADASLRRVFETLTTLLCVGTAAAPLSTCLLRTAESLQTGRLFMAGFVPVYAGFLAAGGAVAEGASYQVFVLFLCEGVVQLGGAVLFPLLQSAAALGIADAVCPNLKLGGFVTGMRSVVTWILGTVTALFSAMLTVRSFVASAADSLAAKSVRLLASSAIPIVGGAVSEAYGTVQGSLHLLGSSVGAVGILVLLCMVLPTLISLALYRLVFRIVSAFADSAGCPQMAMLCGNAQEVLAAAFAIAVSFAVMLIFSAALMLLLIKGE